MKHIICILCIILGMSICSMPVPAIAGNLYVSGGGAYGTSPAQGTYRQPTLPQTVNSLSATAGLSYVQRVTQRWDAVVGGDYLGHYSINAKIVPDTYWLDPAASPVPPTEWHTGGEVWDVYTAARLNALSVDQYKLYVEAGPTAYYTTFKLDSGAMGFKYKHREHWQIGWRVAVGESVGRVGTRLSVQDILQAGDPFCLPHDVNGLLYNFSFVFRL